MRIAVIGGGAAGFFGALSASFHYPNAQIAIYEATQKPLEKVRISGGGRCNVTHHCFDPAELCANYPRGFKELRGPFNRFGPGDTVEWFENQGVKLKVEPDGRMFPTSDNSETIISALRNAAAESNIEIHLGARVKSITAIKKDSSANVFTITFHDRSQIECDRILLSTGSSPQGYRFASELGHEIIPGAPSLFTFKIKDERLTELAGVSFESVSLKLVVGNKHTFKARKTFKQSGPALITHWGLSGPAVLKLSAWGARALNEQKYQAELIINFLPESNTIKIRKEFDQRKQHHPRKRIIGDNPFPIPNRYWKRIVSLSVIDEKTTWANLTSNSVTALTNELAQASFKVNGKGIFKEEFVTCGGVKLSEVDFKTLQSKICSGLFFAGEILDIDGITGGFNFQNAWTTSWIAGSSMGLS